MFGIIFVKVFNILSEIDFISILPKNEYINIF